MFIQGILKENILIRQKDLWSVTLEWKSWKRETAWSSCENNVRSCETARKRGAHTDLIQAAIIS